MNNQPVAWPIVFATGVAVFLIGLIVHPFVLVPIGLALAISSGAFWVRGPRAKLSPEPAPAAVVDVPIEPRFPRNRLLERATVGLGALVGLAAVVPGLGVAVLPALLGRRQRPVDIGPVSAFPEGQFVLTTFISDPQQGEISRRTAYVRNNGPVEGVPSFTIMSSRCTHVGCPTQPGALLLAERARSVPTSDGDLAHLVPLEGLTGFGCPCHGSQFDTEGNRTAGPAPRPLDRYEFSIVGDRLRLDRLVSVSRVVGTGATARFRAFASRSAGEPTQGSERWLYPLQPRQ